MPSPTKNAKADHFDGHAAVARDNPLSAGNHSLLGLLKFLGRMPVPQWNKPAADGAAGTATAETPFYRHPLVQSGSPLATIVDKLSIKDIKYTPGAALTADNANYATITIRKRSALGADLGVVASVTTQITGSGNWTAWVAVNLALANSSDSTVDMAPGDILTVQITKTGSGVVVPLGELSVTPE